MPTYKATDPVTGKSISLTGDSPPTEDELNHVFESVHGSQSQPSSPKGLMGAAWGVANELAPWNVARSLTTDPLGEGAAKGIGYLGGRAGYPNAGAVAGAAIGTGIQMAPDILSMMATGPKTAPRTAFTAKATPETIEGVEAAGRYGIPLSRAEVTGAKSDSLLEAGLEKTLTGSGPIKNFRQTQANAIENAAGSLQNKLGTPLPPSSIGQEAQLGMRSEMGQAAALNRKLWANIPDVSGETPQLSKALDDAISNQSGIQDPKVISIAGQVRNAITKQPPITEVGSASSVRPITPAPQATPSFSELQKARALLKTAIDQETTWDPVLGMKTTDTGRQLSQIKSALDADLSNFGSAGKALPAYQPGLRTDPHAVFQGNVDFGEGEVLPQYILRGNHPRAGGNFSGEQLQEMGVPVVGAEGKGIGQIPGKAGSDLLDQSSEFQTAFQKAKTYHGAFKELQGSKLAKKISSTAPSDIADAVLKPGRVEDVNLAKALMGDEGFETLKKGFVNRLLESKNLGRELAKYDDEFLNSVFRPDELRQLKDMVAIKGRALGAEKLAGNPSGTAQTVGTMATGGALLHAGAKALTNPILAALEGATVLGGPRLMANAYLKYGVKGVPVTSEAFGTLAQRGGFAANALLSDKTRKKAYADFIDKVTTK